uniref:Uncharacterized protein n=1 Tax=Romanomermis culicivorax TaxID=13658 RepID=A0A915HMR2_ROMCU
MIGVPGKTAGVAKYIPGSTAGAVVGIVSAGSIRAAGRIEGVDCDNVFGCMGSVHDEKRSGEVGLDFVGLARVVEKNKVVDGEITFSSLAVEIFFAGGRGCVESSRKKIGGCLAALSVRRVEMIFAMTGSAA